MIFCKQVLDFHRPSNILCRASGRQNQWSSSTVLKFLDADPGPGGPKPYGFYGSGSRKLFNSVLAVKENIRICRKIM
jgi:hypothetical protein